MVKTCPIGKRRKEADPREWTVGDGYFATRRTPGIFNGAPYQHASN